MAPPNFLDEEKTPYCIPAKPLSADVSLEIASSKAVWDYLEEKNSGKFGIE